MIQNAEKSAVHGVEDTQQDVTSHIIRADEEIQSGLYEKLNSGLMRREQYQILTQKLQLWQILSRELVDAI